MKSLKILLRSNSGMTLLEVIVSVLMIAMASLMIFMALITGRNLIRRGGNVGSLGLEAFYGAHEAESGSGEPYSVSFSVNGVEVRGAAAGEIVELREQNDGDEVSFRVFVASGDGAP